MATTAATVGVGLVTAPMIIAAVGLAGYGVWTVFRAVMVYVASAQLGLGPGVQRFTAISHGEERQARAARIFWTALLLYSALGSFALVASQLTAGELVSIFEFPEHLRGDADSMFRLMGVAMLLNLQAAAFINVLQGLERFTASAVTTAAASVVFVAAVALLAGPYGLVGLGYAAIAQQAAIMAVGALTLWRTISRARPSLMPSHDVRSLVGFSVKVQVAALSTLFNTQTDRLVVGVIAPARTVGQLGLGAQVAEAGRMLGAAAVTALVSRMSVVRGGRGEGDLSALYARISQVWIGSVTGVAIIAVASMYPVIASWLGSGYGDAAVFGALLVVGYGLWLITGPTSAYLRAMGLPGLEARYGAVVVVLNAVLTIALALAIGPLGVVIATVAAYAAGSTWFFVRVRQRTGLRVLERPSNWASTLALAALAAGVSLGWGLLMAGALPAPLALLPTGLGTGAVTLGFLAWTGALRRPARSTAAR